MSDNTTAHAAGDYEREVQRTIPMHAEIVAQAIEVGLAAHPSPRRWLDTGGGPGRLVHELGRAQPSIEAWCADPSEAMLAVARANNPDVPPERFLRASSQDLPEIKPFDVISAVLCHHYLEVEDRRRAIHRCKELLTERGALVVFENVRAETDVAHAIQRARWAAWMRAKGRDEESIRTQIEREGVRFFPIRPSEHVDLLERAGFRAVEMFYRAYGQAGFLAIL